MPSALASEIYSAEPDPVKIAGLLFSESDRNAYIKSTLPFMAKILGDEFFPFEWKQAEMRLYGKAFTKAIKTTKKTLEKTDIDACGKIFEYWQQLLYSSADSFAKQTHKRFSLLRIIRSQPPSELVEARMLLAAMWGLLRAFDSFCEDGLCYKYWYKENNQSYSSKHLKSQFAIPISALIDVVQNLAGDTEAQQLRRELLP